MGKRAEGDWTLALLRAPIGDGVTANGSTACVGNGELIIGEDCMFAVGVHRQQGRQPHMTPI